MGFVDLLDRLLGSPGWHREHKRTWKGFTKAPPGNLTPLQEHLREAIGKALVSIGYSVSSWQPDPFHSDGTVFADVLGVRMRVWLYPDGASFGGSIRKGTMVPDRVYEEWGSKTPSELVEVVIADLLSVLSDHDRSRQPESDPDSSS